MPISMTITADNGTEFSKLLASVNATFSGEASAKAPAPKAEDKPKAESKPKEKAEDKPKGDEKPKEKTVDFDKQIVPLITKIAGLPDGSDILTSVLGQFGVERASQLEKDRLPELLDALNDALED